MALRHRGMKLKDLQLWGGAMPRQDRKQISSSIDLRNQCVRDARRQLIEAQNFVERRILHDAVH